MVDLCSRMPGAWVDREGRNSHMELRAYLRILLERWWIVLLAFAVTYATTLALTFLQPERFQAKATFLVGLSDTVGNARDDASILSIISQRPEIATTFTKIADSQLVKGLAADTLGYSQEQRNDIAVTSRLVPGTTMLEVASEAHDATIARDFANAIGQHTIELVQLQNIPYTLAPLDQARLPGGPSSPNKPLNLSLGLVAGLALGVGLAFFSAYLQAPPQDPAAISIRDDATGAYNKRYLVLRLRQELSRAKRNGYPFAVGLLNLNPHNELDDVSPQRRRDVMRKAATLITPYMRDEDVLARYSDTVFGFLLPDMIGQRAKETISDLQILVAGTPVNLEREGMRINIDASAGVAAYHGTVAERAVEADDLLAQAMRALQQAEAATYGKVLLLPGPDEYADGGPNGANGQTSPVGRDPHRTQRL